MTESKNNIWQPGECCSFEELRKYVDGTLKPEEIRRVEEHLADCELCSDIVDGLMAMPADLNLDAELAALHNDIDKQVEKKRKTLVFLSPEKLRFAAAAVLVTLVISTVIMINFKTRSPLYAPDQFSRHEKAAETASKENSQQKTDMTGKDAIADNITLHEPEPVTGGTMSDAGKPISPDGVFFDAIGMADDAGFAAVEETSVTDSDEADYERQSPGTTAELIPKENSKSETLATGGASAPARTESKSRESRQEKRDANKKVENSGNLESPSAVEDIRTVDSDVDYMIVEEKEEAIVDECIEPIAFTVVEEKPEFPGGDSALLRFIADNVQYPVSAMNSSIEGTVYVQFIINARGKVTKVEVVRGVCQSLDDEAVRVIKMLPDWKPGKQRGKPVNVNFVIPIRFKLY
ncbi:MAG: TonB family protein [Bacteroidales bacterium]|nr:TonB family protein [Bacteroidales bacterium]HQL69987.1 TonB family protein [Bacteroidales bacterium]